MPLVAREMDAWLSGSPDRVAVLHCKAGKGRSGTMACTYLLSLGDVPQPPQLERNQTSKERAKRRIEDALDVLPPDEENQPPVASRPTSPPFVTPAIGISDTAGIFDAESGGRPSIPTAGAEKSFTDSLKGVLDLHTARRMKPPSEQDGKAKQGVSIPSQRRFLYYWALILAHEAPSHLWGLGSLKSTNINLQSSCLDKNAIQRPKVLLTQLNIRMRETSNMKMNFVKAANMVIERTNMAKAPENTSTQLWASMARYDDKMVNLLEEWEAYTRDSSGNMGKRRPGSDHLPRGESTEDEVLSHIFKTGKWDKGKMVRSFARLGVTDSKKNEGSVVIDEKHGKIRVYALRPLSDKRWEGLKHDLHKHSAQNNDEHQTIEANATTLGVSRSEANSINEVVPKDAKVDHKIENGIILDAAREVRIKLYMGQVFMGWFWFIPTFHMSQPPPSSTSTEKVDPTILKANMTLSRKDIDFPLGVGSAIIDIDIQMEWAMPSPPSPSAVDISNLEPPLRTRTEDSKIGTDPEPEQSGLAAALQAIVGSDGMEGMGNVGVRETVEAKQGADE
ncbi:Phosphatidylinositol 3,4,5-trisphosphate 3-phosphatase and dual-specificity protein phosphatase PTEN [Psilocybe cubensis]|uniref:Phosphatidylinositol 3,4,5-trisphosphate 3-phosphatase and dual-specificity protein phosphatase PTEN n=1 Tax=Psilocybe cubensis TaxID=181762 RepID=A0ACB8GQC5_PSICU|nr:Phosphatidylinositol 3,4,5-trisphosphate 3-phosphatase and dual-specificity protein phosphatase PTEN [Psilocybe cubensis]KAH9477617.1 Phosphatidylinositol 3,4,5-trisphosphate 3-phosphatase and dual-specificity protein phosphatase PTEN [Psilocybe cubensis]